MSKGFSTMQSEVGTNVQDTSTTMATKIGIWLNDAYRDAARRHNWHSLIDNDFTFESVVDQADYTFASISATDFGEELAVVDIANGHKLRRDTMGGWWNENYAEYSADSISSGNPVRYVILDEASSIKLDPPPDTAETYAMPYRKTVSDLSGSTTASITGIDSHMIMFATGQALAYKRRTQEADWYLNRAEFELKKLIGQENSKVNQSYQFIPSQRSYPLRFGGDLNWGMGNYDWV